MPPVGRVGLLARLGNARAIQLAQTLAAWLSGHGVAALVTPEVAPHLGGLPLETATEAEMAAEGALLLVLGGDGTLLGVARRTAARAPLLLGCNLGRVGFLTELEAADVIGALPAFLEGRFEVDERMMLQCVIHSGAGGGDEDRYVALNDAVVARGPLARLVGIRVRTDAEVVCAFHGDGAILATPTGSTAYSLSAGGPVVHPDNRSLIVTPICPQTPAARPTVVSGAERLRVEVQAPAGAGEVVLAVDAQEGRRLLPGEWVAVEAARERARLVRRPGWDFYSVLRRKLAEEDRAARA